MSASSTGTTSVWDMNISRASGFLPSIRAMMLPRSGTRLKTSEDMPSSASQSRMYSHTAVSSPVGMNPVLTDGMRTRSHSRATISDSMESIWANRGLRSGIFCPPDFRRPIADS